MNEAELQRRVWLALNNAGCVLWRNETAGAWVGQVTKRTGTSITIHNPSFIRAGLCKGSADLVGLTPKGRFLAVEIKKKYRYPSPDQVQFGKAVRNNGGIWGIVRSVDEALELIASE